VVCLDLLVHRWNVLTRQLKVSTSITLTLTNFSGSINVIKKHIIKTNCGFLSEVQPLLSRGLQRNQTALPAGMIVNKRWRIALSEMVRP